MHFRASIAEKIFSEECSSHWSLVRCEEAQNQCLFGRISLQNWDARDRRSVFTLESDYPSGEMSEFIPMRETNMRSEPVKQLDSMHCLLSCQVQMHGEMDSKCNCRL
ncbi:uncharacterized protein [Porites lutea]|uniref:uncharacterized protein n=1 Tax=Porites lutea TaxID=51062 RepID=UPI003CC6762A